MNVLPSQISTKKMSVFFGENNRTTFSIEIFISVRSRACPAREISPMQNNTSSIGGAYVHSHTKSHILGIKRSDPHLVQMPMHGHCQKKSCLCFWGSITPKSPSKTQQKKCLKIGKTTLIFQFATALFSGWTWLLEGKISSYSHVPSEFSLRSSLSSHVWIRAAWGEIHQDLQFHPANPPTCNVLLEM